MPITESDNKSAAQYLYGFPARLREIIGNESVRSFSRRCGVSETTIRGYLEGKNIPTIEKIIMIVETGGAKEASIEWLATGKSSTVLNISHKSLKMAELIESLSDDSQREILCHIEALHKLDRRDQEMEEIKAILEQVLKAQSG